MQKLLVSIVTVLAIMSIAACIILFIYLMVGKHQSLRNTISFTVVVLVASIPMVCLLRLVEFLPRLSLSCRSFSLVLIHGRSGG